jgi:Flp pilus assembly protein TadG
MSDWSRHSPFAKHVTAFRSNEDGGIIVFFAVSLVVFLGLITLSFDLGRILITQTELQSFADSVALAAAGELDGDADATTRATEAAALIADTKTFGDGGDTLQGATDYTLTFYDTLPASDTDPMTSITTSGREAVFVRVDVNSTEVELTFGAAFAALGNFDEVENEVDASATAGFTQFACDVTPLMFCLPSAGYTAAANVGRMIQLRSGGQGTAWGPGNFGFLDLTRSGAGNSGPCAGLGEAQQYRCLLGGIDVVDQCYGVAGGVDTLPGQRVGQANAALNTRFDMYVGALGSASSDPLYMPAPNVIKGLVPNGGGSCIGNNPQTSPDTVSLPVDDCIAAGTCGRFGTGDWSTGRTNYVGAHYGGVDPFLGAGSRWEYYLAEIAAAGGTTSSSPILTGLSETGRPSCSADQSPDPERRVVIAAGVDCTTNPVSGRTLGIPVQEYFRLFLTEPVGADSGPNPNFDIWVEVVGPAEIGGGGAGVFDGIFRNSVQLYR